MTIFAIKEDAELRKVKITDDYGTLNIEIMSNGRQWTGANVDDLLLYMIQEAIKDYFKVIETED